MANQRSKVKRSGVDWMPIDEDGVDCANLADAAQATLFDNEIENVNTGVAYSSGAIVGLRAWIDVFPAAVLTQGAKVVFMIVPSGLTVPTIVSQAQLKQAETFVWFQVDLRPTSALSATTCLNTAFVDIGSARRFNQADRLVAVLVNNGGVAYGAGGKNHVIVDCYVRED